MQQLDEEFDGDWAGIAVEAEEAMSAERVRRRARDAAAR